MLCLGAGCVIDADAVSETESSSDEVGHYYCLRVRFEHCHTDSALHDHSWVAAWVAAVRPVWIAASRRSGGVMTPLLERCHPPPAACRPGHGFVVGCTVRPSQILIDHFESDHRIQNRGVPGFKIEQGELGLVVKIDDEDPTDVWVEVEWPGGLLNQFSIDNVERCHPPPPPPLAACRPGHGLVVGCTVRLEINLEADRRNPSVWMAADGRYARDREPGLVVKIDDEDPTNVWVEVKWPSGHLNQFSIDHVVLVELATRPHELAEVAATSNLVTPRSTMTEVEWHRTQLEQAEQVTAAERWSAANDIFSSSSSDEAEGEIFDGLFDDSNAGTRARGAGESASANAAPLEPSVDPSSALPEGGAARSSAIRQSRACH